MENGFKKERDFIWELYFYSNLEEAPKHKLLATISKASFGRCGRDGCWWGLNLTLNLENGTCTNWSFPAETQIPEFLNLMKVNSISDLNGKPVFALYSSASSWGNIIKGIGINKNLVK